MKYIYGQYHQTEDIKNIERKLIIILICVTFSYHQITFNDKDFVALMVGTLRRSVSLFII